MFNEQAFCPEVSGHTHRHIHLIRKEARIGFLEGLCLALSQVKRGSSLSLAGEATVQEAVPEHKRVEECFLVASVFQNHR